MKKCTECEQFKDISMFSVCKSSPSGYKSKCKPCRSKIESKRQRDYRLSLRDRVNYNYPHGAYNEIEHLFTDEEIILLKLKKCIKCGLHRELNQFNHENGKICNFCKRSNKDYISRLGELKSKYFNKDGTRKKLKI